MKPRRLIQLLDIVKEGHEIKLEIIEIEKEYYTRTLEQLMMIREGIFEDIHKRDKK